jgi:hypothetical protein
MQGAVGCTWLGIVQDEVSAWELRPWPSQHNKGERIMYAASYSAADRIKLCKVMIVKPYMLQAAVLLIVYMHICLWNDDMKASYIVSCSAADRVELCEVNVKSWAGIQLQLVYLCDDRKPPRDASGTLQCGWSRRCMWNDDMKAVYAASCSAADRLNVCEVVILKPCTL